MTLIVSENGVKNTEGTEVKMGKAINEIGKEYKDRIYREFLGIKQLDIIDESKL